MCLFCFSSEPLSEDEKRGKYGSVLGQYSNNSSNFDVTLCQAPCAAPGCCCITMLCFCPVQVYMRHKVLNHVQPGSGWSNYSCGQGYFGGCCCLQPGNLGEDTCPVPCMCLEACLLPGCAVSATSNVIRERYNLGLDDDDVRLIRCNNCLQIFAILLSCVAICTPCEGDDTAAHIVNGIADVVFCGISGCMTAQTNHEMEKQTSMLAPTTNYMGRE